MAASPRYQEYLDALLMQAALVDDFLPRDLLAGVLPAEEQGDILLKAHLMSALRENCTARAERWELRPIARRKVLEGGAEPEVLPDTEIGTALKGESIYSRDGLDKLITDTAEIDTLSLAVSTLEQAGPRAPGHAQLIALSSKLDRLRRDKATDDLLGDSFVGRQQEIADLMEVLDHPQRAAPLRSLHVQGMPGVGKTFLLEELSRQCRARPRIVMVKLDFDRSSLSAGAVDAIFDEISRQIGTAVPEVATELHRLRLESAARVTRAVTQPTATVPFDMLYRMIEMLAEADRQLLFLLDTLEVLHGLGATFVRRLLDDLDRFADKERLDISLISAGRGPILEEGDKRLRGLIRLENLDREVTHAILHKREVPAHLHDRIFDLSKGQPLKLILVSKALGDQGPEAVLDDADMREVGNGYLYRAIMSRVPASIREIAAEGLILPALGPVELTEIVGPALGMQIDTGQAAELLEQLEMQRWMVRPDRDGKLVLLSEVREEILELTYAERPDSTRKINEYAVDHYRDRDPVRTLYHQLQLSRDGGEVPVVGPEIGRQLGEDLLNDLPLSAQDAVLRARGQRSRAGASAPQDATATSSGAGWTRMPQAVASSATSAGLCLRSLPDRPGGRLTLVEADAPPDPVDPGGLKDMRNMLEARELREATHLVKQIMHQPFAMAGEAGMLALTHQWLTGHWSMARTMLDLLDQDQIDEAIHSDNGLIGPALLEMQAEFRFDALCAQLQHTGILEAAIYATHMAQRGGLRGGALTLALLAEDVMPELTEDVGPFLRHFDGRGGRLDRNAADRSASLRSEFALDYGPGRHDPASLSLPQHAQLMAPLNPYAEPLRALLEDLADDSSLRKVHRDVIALRAHLSDLAADLVPDLQGVDAAQERAGSFPAEIATLLGAMGLTAEFARSYAYFSPIPDLPTIARAAERWQQATLGRWEYGARAPATWRQFDHDSLLRDRIDALSGPDGHRRAQALLRVWDDPATTQPSEDTELPKRLQKLLTKIKGTADPDRQITLLDRAGLPSVLQAPLIALTRD